MKRILLIGEPHAISNGALRGRGRGAKGFIELYRCALALLFQIA